MQQLKIILDRIRHIHGKKTNNVKQSSGKYNAGETDSKRNAQCGCFPIIQSSDGILVSRYSMFNSFPLPHGFRAAQDFFRT